jgi:midasin
VEVLTQARTFFDSVFVLLQRLLASAPALHHLFHPTLQWFEEQRQSILPVSSTASSSSTGCAGADTVLDTLLVVIQNLLARSSLQADADGEDNDSFLRDHARVVRQITDALALGDVLARTNVFITSLPDYRVEDVQPAIAAVLPFLKRFLALAHHQFQSQAAWARSLLKLTYVLTRTALTVAKEGFCRPPDSESEGGDGEGKALEGAEGTGLGAGQGAEDVSKEIEDESQVEGLQGEQDEKQEGEKGEGDAIEMSEDFAGDTQDVDKGEDDQQGEDDKDEDEEDGPEPEDQLGDLDPMDPEAVDEKLWSGEKGPEDDRDDQRAGEGADQTGQEESEMGAKEEGKKEQPKKEDAGDQPREVEEATDEQQPEETGEEVDQPQEPTGEGTQMDDHVQEADTLDLPAELDLDGADDDMEPADDDEDMAMDEDEQEVDGADIDGPEDERQSTPRPEDAPQPDDAHQPEDAASPSQGQDATHEAPGETAEEDAPEDPTEETTTANPDVSAGPTNAAADASALDHDVGDAVPEDGQAESVQRAAGNDAGDQQGAPDDDR